MKILACGDREWSDQDKIRKHLSFWHGLGGVILIHGACRGADRLAGEVGDEFGWTVRPVAANWAALGKSAGFRRNNEMLDMKPNVVVAFHSDLSKSKGTAHTVREAKKRGIPVEIVT